MEKIQFKKTYVGFLYDDEEDNKIIKSMGGTFRDLSIVCVRISNNINRHHYFHHSFWS